tara:strand:- start:514 stop:795 length:282 start_codon:yes stop_codon:yes gene_type:complete
MTVQDIMDRSGVTQTGRAIAYIKEALDEIALESPTHVKRVRMDISKDRRFYSLPWDYIKVLDIRVKDHQNEDSLYKSIPRSIYEPEIEDSDGI